MDDITAYQTELTPRMKRNAIVGGVVAVVVAIFVSNVSGSPPDNPAMKDQPGTFTQPIMVPAVAANSTQPFGATATTANPTQPAEVLATPANSNQPPEALYGEVDHSVATTATTSRANSTRHLEAPTSAQPVHSSKRASKSKKDITQMQARLGSLGYLSASPTGTFGPKTRAALRAFKSTNGLPEDEVWDDETKIRLSSKHALRMPSHVADAVKQR
jgi:hypothetical protein